MRRTLGILTVALIGLLALVLVGLATPIGRGLVAGIAERAGSSQGLTISIETLRGWPPFWFGADKVTIADSRGPFVQIDNAEIDVGFLRLLTGNIALDAVTAERVQVARAPELPPSEGTGTLLPFMAERFAIARLDLGEALVGRSAVLAVEGAFASGSDGSLEMEVHANRSDGENGRLDVVLSRADADALISADISASEAANGILVGLIGRPSGPAYELKAEAVPTGDALRGSVTLSSDAAAQFNGGFALTPNGAAKRLEVTARGDLAGLVPPDFADLLAGPIDIGVDADWMAVDGDFLPAISIRQGRLSTANFNATASGTLSRTVADLSLDLNIADPAGAAIALPMLPERSKLQSVSLRGTVAPSNGVVRLDLVGNIAGLQVGSISVPGTGLSLAVETAGGTSLAGGELPFALRLEADEIRTASGDISASPEAPLVLTADGTFDAESGVANATADLRVAGGRVDFDGSVSASEAAGTATATFADVRPLSVVAGRQLTGAASASVEGRFFGEGGIDLRVLADLTDFDPANDTVRRLLSGRSRLATNLARTSDGTLSLSALSFDGEVLDATGEASLEADMVEASLEGTIRDLSVLAKNTDGAATFTAEVSGAMQRPTVEADLRIADGHLLEHPIRDGVARFQGSATEDGWAGTAKLDGSFAGKPLAGTVDIVAADGDDRLAFPGIDLTIDDNRISGALDRANDGLLSGTLDVAAPNLATLAALALTEVAGSARGRLSFSRESGRQAIAASFAGSDVSYSNVSSRSIEGQATIADAFGAPRIDGSVTMSVAEIGSAHFDTISASASAEGDSTAFQVRAEGDDIDLAGTGVLTRETGTNILRINTVSGSAYRVPVELQEPVTIRLDDQRGNMPTTKIAVGGGSIVVEGAVSPNFDLTIVIDRVPASVANGFAPNLEAAGTVSGRASVTGTPAAPNIAWQAEWARMQIAATRGASLPPLQVSASGTATPGDTTIDGRISGAGLALAVRGSAPFTGEGLALRVEGTAPLSLLALESARELGLAGNAQVDVSVAGSTKTPQISGSATLSEATIVDRQTGFGIAGATGRIAFDGQRATIERIAGRLAQGGQIVVAGSVDIGSAQMPANITITISDGRYNDGRVINAAFDANLSIDGPLLGNGIVSGTVVLGRTEIQLPDRLAGGATAIDVTHVNTPPGFVPPLAEETERAARSSGTGSLGLDINLNSTGAILVRGFGVDAEFGGSLRLANTIADPLAVGAFTMRRGRIEVVGRRFELVSGTLTFSGDLVPVVDFTASTSTSDAVVSVIVIGPADDPTITFTSNPDLPEEEILSRLLFNRNVSSLSVLQAAQLVDAAAQFSGLSGGKSFFARIRDAIGVDDLDIRQNASGGTTVGIGKRINENVRLGVEAGSGSQEGRVTIDLDITPNLSVRGEAGEGSTGSVGLSYEREY